MFRGQRVDNKQWVYGDLVNSFEGVHIVSSSDYFKPSNDQHPELIDVLPKTVGQYTGLTDKNEVEIYMGEIIFNDDREENAIVKWDDEKAMWICHYIETNNSYPLWESISNLYYSIGNIHNNPELIQSIK